MHLVPRLTHARRTDRSAEALLGGGHPLVRAMSRSAVARERAVVVAGLTCVAAAGVLRGVPGALALLVAAAVVQVLIAAQLALLVDRRRDCARDVIIEGRGELPIDAVERERTRLEDPAWQEELARDIDHMRDIAAQCATWPPAARPFFVARVVAAVEPELGRVAARLQTGAADARGVAMLERLIRHGESVLYGDDVRPLREELRRVLFLMER
jgi:hypothetical protein